MQELTLSVVHQQKGRMRLRLSHHLLHWDQFRTRILSHQAVNQIQYTPIVKSLLVHFDATQIKAEELILRLSVTYSLEHHFTPIKVSFEGQQPPMENPAIFSGVLLTLAIVARLPLRALQPYQKILEVLASSAVALAVLNHGFNEFRERGDVDPEVISVLYLVSALFSGNSILSAGVLTWFTSFSRHLLVESVGTLKVHAAPAHQVDDGVFEVKVTREKQHLRALLRRFSALAAIVYAGGRSEAEKTLREIQNSAESHHNILKGLEEHYSSINLVVR